jgi:hypothetical protein
MSGENVKKPVAKAKPVKDEVLPEYDFGNAKPNHYAALYAAGGAQLSSSSRMSLRRFPTHLKSMLRCGLWRASSTIIGLHAVAESGLESSVAGGRDESFAASSMNLRLRRFSGPS